MSSGYVRQAASNISTGLIINASDFNAEYNQIQAAYDGTTGHDHTGGIGLGPKIGLTNAVSGILPSANGGTGIAFITFAGPTALRTYTLPDSNATILTNASTLGVANGGTGLTAGSSGGLLYFSGTGTIASSTALGANQILLGAGAGLPPASLSLGTSTTVLHGNAGGAPTWAAVNVGTEITGTLAIANGGTGQTTANAAFNAFAPSQTTNSGKFLTTDGTNTSWGTVAAGFGDPGSSGIVVRTALNTSTARTITGTAGTITVTNGDGTAGNPTLTIAASYIGQNTITTLGTITTGTWSGTTLALNKGGTGQTTKAAAFDALQPMTTAGDVIYGGASGTGTRLAANATGTNKYLQSVSSGNPAWVQVADADLSVTDITTNNVSTSNHGFAPKLPNDSTKFLNGVGSYAIPGGRLLKVTYFSASGTWTPQAGCNAIEVELWGGGGGQSGTGGTSTFDVMSCTGGTPCGGTAAGGTASGGDINIPGGSGGSTNASGLGGNGGNAPRGGQGGQGGNNKPGDAPGGGSGNSGGAQICAGAGAYSYKFYSAQPGSQTVTIGAGGTGAPVGAAGGCSVKEYA